MKYNLVPSSKAESPNIKYIYILPSSSEGSEYSIVYPDLKAEDIIARKIIISIFDGCSGDALNDIESILKDLLHKKQLKYMERLNTILTAGVGVFILGIINWLIPDPLPFIDELLFSAGGGLTVWKALKDRKVKLPELVDKIYRYRYEGGSQEVEADPFLTLIFKSIRCKLDPLAAGEQIDGMDSIEVESLWMTRYLNIQDISGLIEAGPSKFADLMHVIERVFPVRKLAKLEDKKQTQKIQSHLETCRQETINKTGITNSALAVYIEFYRMCKRHSS